MQGHGVGGAAPGKEGGCDLSLTPWLDGAQRGKIGLEVFQGMRPKQAL